MTTSRMGRCMVWALFAIATFGACNQKDEGPSDAMAVADAATSPELKAASVASSAPSDLSAPFLGAVVYTETSSEEDKINAKIAAEPAYRDRLVRTPQAALAEVGVVLPPEAKGKIQIHDLLKGTQTVVADPRSVTHAVLPAQMPNDERSIRPAIPIGGPPHHPPPPPPHGPTYVQSEIFAETLEHPSCGVLPEGTKGNDPSLVIPLPQGALQSVSVRVDVDHGFFGGNATIVSQKIETALLDGKPTQNGALAVKLHWWFNGWSYVNYTVHVIVTSTKSYPALVGTGRHIKAWETCPANDWLQKLLSKVQCFFVSVGVTNNPDYSEVGGPSIGVSFSCPAIPDAPGPLPTDPPYYCPPTGNPNPGSGVYCLPNWPHP